MSPEVLKLLEYAAYGAVGALAGVVGKSGELRLPRLRRRALKDGDVVIALDLGFIAALLLGAILAAWIDGRPQTALAYGLASGYAGPSLLSAMVTEFQRRFLAPLPAGKVDPS